MSEPLYHLKVAVQHAIDDVYGHKIEVDSIALTETKKEFEGDFTYVVFPLTKTLRQGPQMIAESIGSHLISKETPVISGFNVIKGFLNFTMPSEFWIRTFRQMTRDTGMGLSQDGQGTTVVVEYSSPNTNKPLHLGHIRNILLGWSTAKILESVGYQVVRTKIVNDRGIAICKSMLAWQKFGEGKTPKDSGTKGDHFVGAFYVIFEQKFREEYEAWQSSEEGKKMLDGRENAHEEEEQFFKKFKNQYFNEHSALGKEAKAMLLDWEAGKEDVRKLWAKMNGWVYDGFDHTYARLGVSFDFKDYESETYVLGKDIIAEGLQKGSFYTQADGSVWVDLEDRGLDKKILLRSDGTSVYMTQDLGTAQMRFEKTGAEKMIYVVGDEQDYHFQVLFETLKKLGEPYAHGLYHLSYGMVDLPSGKMKSREGTVVDADDLIEEVIGEARSGAEERGELADLSDDERKDIYRKIGLAALKFFILKVNPKKRMVFDPRESVDLQGQTGPYIQNAYVRIRSIERKNTETESGDYGNYNHLDKTEKELVSSLMNYPQEVGKAAQLYDPSIIANFTYDLAKKFHKFYHDVRILGAESTEARSFRIALSRRIAQILAHAMDLLGIEMPERM